MRSIDAELRDSLERFGSGVADIRKLRGLSQMDLAERVGLHHNTVANIERGDVDASILAVNLMLLNLGVVGISLSSRGFQPIRGEGRGKLRAFPGLATNKAVMAAQMGAIIKRRRLDMGAGLDDVSMEAGIHRNTLINVEQGLVAPSTCTIYRIYRALGVRCVSGSDNGIYLEK